MLRSSKGTSYKLAPAEELPFIASNLGFSIADIQKFQNNYNTWIKSNKSPAGIFGKCP